ncbi:hypothetical protein [Kitasatospora sp. NPDC056181]|uniref:hypothetical protein n=1 Tax=Kitasatospora sp. NPDC056181 TaxID=3345737 RepID=UPI0035DF8F6C
MRMSSFARIAKIVPLAVVAAVGVSACGPTDGSAGAPSAQAVQAAPASASAAGTFAPATAAPASSAPASSPAAAASTSASASVGTSVAAGTSAASGTSAPASASPATGTSAPASASPATGTSAPASASSAAGTAKATAPAAASAAASAARDAATKAAGNSTAAASAARGIAVTFDGLREGQQVEVGDVVSFSVTWKNNDPMAHPAVAPVVATQMYEGAPCSVMLSMAEGTLERKDAGGWKSLHLSQGGGMDYAMSGNDAAFSLGPGESRTVEYRMKLDVGNRPGRLAVEADAYVPSTTRFDKLAGGVVRPAVVDHHRPKVSVLSGPTELVVGKTPTEFRMSVTREPGASGRPVITVPDLASAPGLLTPQDVDVAVNVRGEWKTMEVVEGCDGGLVVAPSQLESTGGTTVEYTFRVGITKPWKTGEKLTVEAGAVADGHYAEPVAMHPAVKF